MGNRRWPRSCQLVCSRLKEYARIMNILFRRRLVFVLFGFAVLVTAAAWIGGFVIRDVENDTKQSFTIGLITNNPNGLRNINGFRSGMEALGYVDGENTTFIYSGNPVPAGELEAAIKQMVVDGADLIFTAGTPTGIAAKVATRESAIPVVFGVVADPVAAGIMADLTRPGGNMTGVMLSENQARRLELLHSVLPDVKTVLLPYDPEDAAPVSSAAQLTDAASSMGLTLVHAYTRTNDEVSALLADLPQAIDAIFLLPGSLVNRRINKLIEVANARKIPVSGPSTAQVEAGALMSYGIVHGEVGVQASRIADRILRGADPSTMPVETADFYLTVNVAAANRIGLDISEEVLQQADVILREDRFGL